MSLIRTGGEHQGRGSGGCDPDFDFAILQLVHDAYGLGVATVALARDAFLPTFGSLEVDPPEVRSQCVEWMPPRAGCGLSASSEQGYRCPACGVIMGDTFPVEEH